MIIVVQMFFLQLIQLLFPCNIMEQKSAPRLELTVWLSRWKSPTQKWLGASLGAISNAFLEEGVVCLGKAVVLLFN